MKIVKYYPTHEHEKAAEKVVEYFSKLREVDSVVLTCSCARGKASPDSCLDMAVLIKPEVTKENIAGIQKDWEDYCRNEYTFKQLKDIGKYAHVEVDFFNGKFIPEGREWTSGPDSFELEIGNLLVYSVSVFSNGKEFEKLKNKWLPYYDNELRNKRLKEVCMYLLNNLDHISLYIKRGLYFQCFDRLYNAYKEFLQALFISKKVYPISYDKWIKEQIVEILELPELYYDIVKLFELSHFESNEINKKANDLKELLTIHIK
ncbi:MAG: nucleotidyltransferase domain-containing protein [Spirochaetales bacterium]|nr:nucleotidyltransferase domain-containing protein [Spirochaetales bacterium]